MNTTTTSKPEAAIEFAAGRTHYVDSANVIHGDDAATIAMLAKHNAQRSTYRTMNAKLAGQASDRELVAQDHGLDCVIEHERGHIVYAQLRAIDAAAVDAIGRRIVADPPSGRATTTAAGLATLDGPHSEAFAEAYAAIASGEADRWGLSELG
jgi:hypothetical protein